MDESKTEERRRALEMNKKLMEFCDELWVFRDEITEGMREEIEHFKKLKGEDKIKYMSMK